MKLLPAILTESINLFQEQLELAKQSERVETIHIDVIDGFFVDNITLTPLDLTVMDFGDLTIDFHFMTEEPMDFVHECEALKSYLPIRRMIGQIERMSFQEDFLQEVKRSGWQPTLGLDIFTPLNAINEEAWSLLNGVLIMGVEAGHQNKIFNLHALEKARQLRERFANPEEMSIIMDGGIKETNLRQILESGANEVSVGSTLWKSNDPAEEIEVLHEIAEQLEL